MNFIGQYHWELLDEYVDRLLSYFIILEDRDLVQSNLLFFVETLANCGIIFCDGILKNNIISVICNDKILSMLWNDGVFVWKILSINPNDNWEICYNDYWEFDKIAYSMFIN